MRLSIALIPYKLLLPLLFLIAFPGWVLKMLRRGGFNTALEERGSIYLEPDDFEPCGAIHIHSISVGETMLALKLIRTWRKRNPEQSFVIATGTATGHQVATNAKIPNIRVTYAPLDFSFMVRRYLNRFEPQQIILIEGEAWPHLLETCQQRNIPIALVNARMSPRSARRYRKFSAWVKPVFSMLDLVAIQELEDSKIWRDLGIDTNKIHHTGSLKLDPGSAAQPTQRPEFQMMLDSFGRGRKVILAASTFIREHALIAKAVRDAEPNALIAIAPRHAERRNSVQSELLKAGFTSVLRSQWNENNPPSSSDVFVIDSTGELRDWTAHADVVIIGKSFLSKGGQNPCEAIFANKPLIFGPHMSNFEPLASILLENKGAILASTQAELSKAIQHALNPNDAAALSKQANAVLNPHDGATERIIDLVSH